MTNTEAPPTGWTEDPSTGHLACPHRDLSVCDTCDHATPEAVEVVGAHFWIADPADREALAAEMAA